MFQCSHVGSIYNLPLNKYTVEFCGFTYRKVFLKIIHSTIIKHDPSSLVSETWIQREDSKVIWKLLTAWDWCLWHPHYLRTNLYLKLLYLTLDFYHCVMSLSLITILTLKYICLMQQVATPNFIFTNLYIISFSTLLFSVCGL